MTISPTLKSLLRTSLSFRHSCFLIEFPSSPASPSQRGPRILLDPVFSHRCSPSQWVGPARFTPAPCKVEEIPEVDAVVIVGIRKDLVRCLGCNERCEGLSQRCHRCLLDYDRATITTITSTSPPSLPSSPLPFKTSLHPHPPPPIPPPVKSNSSSPSTPPTPSPRN